MSHERAFHRLLSASILALGLVFAHGAMADRPDDESRLLVLKDQGSFAVGGDVITNPGTFNPITLTPDGQTIHGDHAYVQFQIPPDARKLPLVMWHGGGQMAKTWETTPDGRDGFQNIFLRRGFSTYILDQPRRGRAGRGLEGTTIDPAAGRGEQEIFIRFRLGIWPDYFPRVQFSRDPDALDQWYRQQTPDTGPSDETVITDAVVALFEKIGPATLLSHSASGYPGWLTAIESENVKSIVSYEPVGWVFPEGEVPTTISTAGGDIEGTPVPLDDFEKLTTIPIQIVYGDFVPEEPSIYPGIDIWRGRLETSALFVDAVNAHGGDAELLHLPEAGVFGNTHFPMSDLNNVKVADLLFNYLKEQGLAKRGQDNR